MLKSFFSAICLGLILQGTLFGQGQPPAYPSPEEDSEAFFPKRKSLNSAIERNREVQRHLQEGAYPTI